jgi:4-hydroxy-tetrahydrodipicolinate reductase
MKIALLGYGKMGKAIEEVVLEEGRHEIVLKIGSSHQDQLTVSNLKMADVAIDFTQPESAYSNVMLCFEAKIPIVVGTTSWAEGLEKAKKICLENNHSLFASPNFSIGVNLFFQLNTYLAKLMRPFNEYQLTMAEIHHTEKKDAPSGTAIKLANDIIASSNNRYSSWSLDKALSEDIIPITAIREPHVPGTHYVNYTSEIDYIQISHEAKGRKGFAVGAVRAAEFIYGKKGFFTMDDFLNFN